MIFVSRSFLYQSYNWANPFNYLINYIKDRDISNRDIFYWDGVEQLQVPFSNTYYNNDTKKYWDEFHQILIQRNINIFAVGGDWSEDELPNYPRITLFRWKTALLHFIHHSINVQYKSDDVRIKPTFTKLFNCLNRHPRQERVLLVDSLYKDGLFQYGDVSWNKLISEWEEFPSTFFKHWNEKRMLLDIPAGDSEIGPPEGLVFSEEGQLFIRDYHLLTDYVLNNNCLFNITTESIPNTKYNCFFITEKTWKPILLGQPSFVIGNYWYKKHMEDMGFKFYDDLVDYSFYGNNEHAEFFDEIVSGFTKELSKFKNKNYQELYESIKHVVEHNRKRAYDILNDDPYISDEFVAFYNKHRYSWDEPECDELKVDIDIHKVFKNKLYA